MHSGNVSRRWFLRAAAGGSLAAGLSRCEAGLSGSFEEQPIVTFFLAGHTHVRNVFQWDYITKNAPTGYNVFNSDNSSHFSGDAQAFFCVELLSDDIVVREYSTKDGWNTGEFTPQVWRRSHVKM